MFSSTCFSRHTVHLQGEMHLFVTNILDLIKARKMEYIKIINSEQTKGTYACQNKKEKLLQTIAAIWLNKMCRSNNLTPKSINVTVSDYNCNCYGVMVTTSNQIGTTVFL